jgi:hypothetical protein
MAAAAAASFALQVLRGRWFMAYGSFLIMSAAGATYIFAIYSEDIKSALGYTQEQLNTVGFFKDVGANVGIHAGLVAEATPPWLVLAVGAAVSVAFLGTIRIIRAPRSPAAARREHRAFCGFLYVSLALAAFLMVAIILQKRFPFTRAEYGVCAAVVLSMLLAPFAVVLREEAALFRKNTAEARAEAREPPSSLATVAAKPAPVPLPLPEPLPVTSKPETVGSRLLAALRPPPRGEDYTILQALVSVDMLLLFTATVFGVGGTLTAIDNMGQIGESLGYPQRSVATFVSLISIWNYLGRVAAGFASEALLARHRVPRPLVLAAVLLLTVPGHLLIALGVPGSLYVASVAIGFCFGAAQPLILASVSELFGLRYYSTLYNLCGTASPVGSYILNVRVAGRMYDREAARQGASSAAAVAGKGVTCIGVRCYRESFLIITAVTVAAAAVTAALAWRTRDFYAGDIYAKFKAGISEDRDAEPKEQL